MKKRSLAFALCLAFTHAARAQDTQIEMQQWFRDARFGMFIHWGVYSVLGAGEWVMNNREVVVAPSGDAEIRAPRDAMNAVDTVVVLPL